MKIFTTISEISGYLRPTTPYSLLPTPYSIGFVPTMGALHEGHMSLIRKAKSENQITICSIYVNPLQFNDRKDYEKYPRNYDADIEMLEKANCDIVFMPATAEMQPIPDTRHPIPDYDLNGLDKVMEGKFRPGHFRGVVYIVKRFFEIIQPTHAYFGMKDFQQLVIIKYVSSFQLPASSFQLPVNIVACPTLRARDGLALSSRNMRLNPEQRKIAPNIYKTLLKVKEQFKTLSDYQIIRLSDKSDKSIYQWVQKEIEKNQLMKLEYFEIVDTQPLLPVKNILNSQFPIACIAVYLGDVRLIDNIILF